MRPCAKPLVVVVCLGLGPVLAAPGWTERAGLDFWNVGAERDRLSAAEEEARRLDNLGERLAARAALSERLASGLCADLIPLHTALAELEAVAQDDPDWLADLRQVQCTHEGLPASATDRDVLARYLFAWVERIRSDAEHTGDLSRATSILERLLRLDRELGLRSAARPSDPAR